MRLLSSKQINKPCVRIVQTVNGYGYAVMSEDTLKLTREPMDYHIFAYVWAVPITHMLKSLHGYLDLKGIRN